MPKRPRTPKEAADFVNDALALWRQDLILHATGSPKPLLANAITALRQAPAWTGILAFDAFRQQIMLRGQAPWMTAPAEEAWTGTNDILTADWLQHEGIAVTVDIAAQAVEVVARDSRFHPVLDYLAGCQWDGVARLDSWTVRYLGVRDTPYVRAVSAKWMISAVARVHNPGCKVDTALIFEGDQDLGKSSALRVLARPWFADEIADLGTKDSALQLAGVWIVELAELDSISRGEVSRIKAFMSRSTDRYRPPYGRRVIEQPRQCVFGGTVNSNQYLRDETGGRRFWPIDCTRIDIEGLTKARDQLWAEATARYQAGEKWWLDSKKLTSAAAEEQRGRYTEDAWEGAVQRWIAGKKHVTVAEVLRYGIGIGETAEWTQSHMTRVARCLRAAGWKRKRVRPGGGKPREWRYCPPNPPRRPRHPRPAQAA